MDFQINRRKITGKVLLVLIVASLLFTVAASITWAGEMEVVSDESVDNAVLCDVNSAWPDIPGAEWIWSTYNVAHPVDGEQATFTKNFNIPGKPQSGLLDITCDNAYEVSLNSYSIGDAQLGSTTNPPYMEAHVSTDGWDSIEDYDVTNELQEGSNTLEVTGYNEYMAADDEGNSADGTIESNPGGCIFKLDIDYEAKCDCSLELVFVPEEQTGCEDFVYELTIRNSGEQGNCKNVKIDITADPDKNPEYVDSIEPSTIDVGEIGPESSAGPYTITVNTTQDFQCSLNARDFRIIAEATSEDCRPDHNVGKLVRASGSRSEDCCRKTGTLEVIKDVYPDDDSQWELSYSGDASDSSVEGDGGRLGPDEVPTGTYTVSEAYDSGDFGSTAYTNSYSCSDESSGAGASVEVTVNEGDTTSCTFTNTRKSHDVEVVKDLTPDDDTFDLFINEVEKATAVGDGGSGTASAYVGDTVTVSELGNSADLSDYNTSLSCSGADLTTNNGTSGEFTMPENDVTCTFVNERKTGNIKIVKNTVGGNDTFGFTISGPTPASPDVTTADGSGNTTEEVDTGTYTVEETTIPAGWTLMSSTCEGSFAVGEDQTVTCEFNNTKQGTIVVEKDAVGGDGDFTFAGDVSGTIRGGGTLTVSDLSPATYTSTETVPDGWNLTSIDCNDDNSSGDIGTGIATFNLEAGETVTCTFENTKRATIRVEKSTTPSGEGTDFDFTGDLGNFTLSDGDYQEFSVTIGKDYTVSEIAPSGWELTSITNDDDSDPANGATVSPGAGQVVTVTFNNYKEKAKIELTPSSATNGVEQEHTVTANVWHDTGDGFPDDPNAPNSTEVTLTISGEATFVDGGGTTKTVNTSGGTVSVDIVSSTPGTNTISATADIHDGVKAQTGTDPSGDDVTKDYVEAQISLTPESDSNAVGDSHNFTATLEVNDGTGWVAGAGETVEFAILSGPGSLSSASATTDGDGEATVTLTSTAAGTTVIQASFDGTAAGESVATTSNEAEKNWFEPAAQLTMSA
ncbi:Ig-like domain-containing protein, partial [Candidatus Bipolaricaulota bacterium]|nr:Ig-like domain-containing protein [Candidatus Bipolaricaulota bacterium]